MAVSNKFTNFWWWVGASGDIYVNGSAVTTSKGPTGKPNKTKFVAGRMDGDVAIPADETTIVVATKKGSFVLRVDYCSIKQCTSFAGHTWQLQKAKWKVVGR